MYVPAPGESFASFLALFFALLLDSSVSVVVFGLFEDLLVPTELKPSSSESEPASEPEEITSPLAKANLRVVFGEPTLFCSPLLESCEGGCPLALMAFCKFIAPAAHIQYNSLTTYTNYNKLNQSLTTFTEI